MQVIVTLKKTELRPKSNKLVSAGVGFVALDVIMKETNMKNPRLCTGGSCGNVMIILSSLGWSSFPIAYIGKDFASRVILQDMKSWGVKTEFIIDTENASTPIVIEEIKNKTRKSHQFKFKCPYCNARLPKNRPLPQKLILDISNKLPNAKVFYFDRVSKSAVKLAKEQRAHGALIFFEPYRIDKRKLFQESLEVAHVVKYSGEQINDLGPNNNIPLEIKTLGSKGLKYRFTKNNDQNNEWKTIDSFEISPLIDAAGAGDWCTAGIIHTLGQKGFKSFARASRIDVEKALRLGQTLAAINCVFEGARGLMYTDSESNLKSVFIDLFKNEKIDEALQKYKLTVYEKQTQIENNLCPSCRRQINDCS